MTVRAVAVRMPDAVHLWRSLSPAQRNALRWLAEGPLERAPGGYRSRTGRVALVPTIEALLVHGLVVLRAGAAHATDLGRAVASLR